VLARAPQPSFHSENMQSHIQNFCQTLDMVVTGITPMAVLVSCIDNTQHNIRAALNLGARYELMNESNFQSILKTVRETGMNADKDYETIFGYASVAFMNVDQLARLTMEVTTKYKPVQAIPVGEGGAGAGVPVVKAEIELPPLDKAARALSKARTAVVVSRRRVESAMEELQDAEKMLHDAKMKESNSTDVHKTVALASVAVTPSQQATQDLEDAEVALAAAINVTVLARLRVLDAQEALQHATDKMRADVEVENAASEEHLKLAQGLRRKRNPV